MVIQQYQDPRVGKYLKYGYWYQAHRGQLRHLERNLLIALLAVIWGIFSWHAYNFILSQSQYNQVLSDLTQNRVDVLAVQQARAVAPVQIGSVAVLAGENAARADFMVIAENTNANWNVAVDYIFVWPEGQTTSESAVVLPQSKAVLSSRGITVNSLPVGAELQITGQHWYRLRSAAEKERLLVVKNGIIIDSPVARSDSGRTVGAYTVKNQTIYDWLTPRFVVVLSQGQDVIAVGINEMPLLPSGAEQAVEYRWLQVLPTSLSVEVYPMLNPFDETSYRLPRGGDYAL